jgi:hypothetical protein
MEKAEIHQNEVRRLGAEMNNKSFGIEHLFREIALIYDCFFDDR